MTKRVWLHHIPGNPLPGCVLDEFYINWHTNKAYQQIGVDWNSVTCYSFVNAQKKPTKDIYGAYKTALSEAVEFGHWDIVQAISKRLQGGDGE
jgi:hypothetical protein